MATKKFEQFTAINETGLYVVETKDGKIWNCTGPSVCEDGHIVLNTIKAGPLKIAVTDIIRIY